MPLALSRTLDVHDYEQLEPELVVVDHFGTAGQHEHRRWEYALAMHAVQQWLTFGREVHSPLYDVGGAGSTFHQMLTTQTGHECGVIDPHVTGPLAQLMHGGTPLADIVTCISVIEHVKDLDSFLYHLACLVAPGGLLFLTMDYWNHCGPDTAHFSHMRERIFCRKSYSQLRNTLATFQLHPFGEVDTTWHGAHVYNYTFASLALEKRR